MKFLKTTGPFYSFLLLMFITIGIIYSVRATPPAAQDVQLAMAKSKAMDNHSPDGRDFRKEFSYPIPLTHFEPLLLFMLGTLLLSIVTGINLLRSGKLNWHPHTNSQTGLRTAGKLGAPTSKTGKNSAT